MNPLVSVVIPAYNAVETIIACVKSVLEQTYKYIEIIVIDDGSTDATRRVLEEYQRVVCISNLQIISQENSGPSKARNLGIKLAKGEFIAFLDADDLWVPTKIEKQLHVFEMYPSATLVGTLSYGSMYPDGSIVEVSINKLIYRNYFTTSTIICRRWVFENLRFNESQRYSEDYRLWMEVVSKYGGAWVLKENLVIYANHKKRFGEKGLSANLWEMKIGRAHV